MSAVEEIDQRVGTVKKIFQIFFYIFVDMSIKNTQKRLLSKTWPFKTYRLSKRHTLKHFLCGRGFARDVYGGTNRVQLIVYYSSWGT